MKTTSSCPVKSHISAHNNKKTSHWKKQLIIILNGIYFNFTILQNDTRRICRNMKMKK